MTTDTDQLARRLVASAERKERPALNDPRTEALIKGIADGFAPVIRDLVATRIFANLVPIRAAIEELEAQIAAIEARKRD